MNEWNREFLIHLLNVHVCEKVSAAAHFVQFERVHDFALRGFMNVFLGQINDLLGVHAASHFQASHFAEIVFVLVSNDVAAGEALNRDNHCLIYVGGCLVCSDCYITPLFLNQFLKIKEFSFIALFIYGASLTFGASLIFGGFSYRHGQQKQEEQMQPQKWRGLVLAECSLAFQVLDPMMIATRAQLFSDVPLSFVPGSCLLWWGERFYDEWLQCACPCIAFLSQIETPESRLIPIV